MTMQRMSRWAPLVGVLYVAMLATAIFSASTPDTNKSGAQVISFFTKHHTTIQVQGYVLAYASIFLICFAAVLLGALRRQGANLLAVVSFGGAVLMAGGYAMGSAMNFVLTDHTSRMSVDTAQTLNNLNNNLPFIALFAGLCTMMLFAGIAILTTKALPAWMGWIAIVTGVAAATGIASWPALMLSGLWTLVASVMLCRETDDGSAATISMPDSAAMHIPAQGRPQDSPTSVRS